MSHRKKRKIGTNAISTIKTSPDSPSHSVAHLFDSVRRISGPASYYVFDFPVTHNVVYLFGDYHFSHKNQCSGCDKDKYCRSISKFIEKAEEDAIRRDTSLDVFMEFPYVVAEGPNRDMVLAKIKKVFSKDEHMGGAREVLSKIFGKDPQYIGIFSTLYKHFSDRFYHHSNGNNRQRFHYADARFEFNVKRFLSPSSHKWIQVFHTHVNSVVIFRRLLEAFLLGYNQTRSFQEEMYAIFGNEMTAFEGSLTSKTKNGKKTLHKIAKQVYKLPPKMRAIVEKYIGDKLDSLCSILKHDIRYEDGVRMIQRKSQSKGIDGLRDGTLAYIRSKRLTNYIGIFIVFMELIAQTIMMDVYLLSRLLLYTAQSQSTSGTSIVYAGDYHISVYADFFMRYLNIRPMGCSVPKFPSNLTDGELQGLVKRCVEVELGTCKPALSSVVPKTK